MMYVVWGLVVAAVMGALDQSLFGAMTGLLLGLLWARQNEQNNTLQAIRKHLWRTDRAEHEQVRNPELQDDQDAGSRGVPVVQINETPDKGATLSTPVDLRAFLDKSELIKGLGQRLWSWFSTGNVPVKVGLIVLFAGVAALLKYAYDAGMLHVPLMARVGIVTVAALVAFGFGWYQRQRRRVFALSLQGGAIGVLLLVIFVSFRLYGLMGPLPAFVLLVALVAGTGLLAVYQDSRTLAVLGLFAGFAAPILVATGHGSHIMLFAYYAVLNLGIFGIAWMKSWRVLNLMGFVATFVIATIWGVLNYRPIYFASTEPFLILYFLLYLTIPWLYLRTRFDEGKKLVDASILFGNPLISLVLQGHLLEWQAMPIAISSLAIALIYLLAAWTMSRNERLGLLFEAWLLLAILLATLAVPLALGASLTTGVLAVEGAGMVWLGFRQGRQFMPWVGLIMQVLAALALLVASIASLKDSGALPPVFNTEFLGAMLLVAAGSASCWCFYHQSLSRKWLAVPATVLCLWSLFWWLLAVVFELLRTLNDQALHAGIWLLFAVTAWCLAECARRACSGPLLGRVMAWVSAALSACIIVFVLMCLLFEWQPLMGWLLLAVLASAGAGWRMLACLRDYRMAAVFAHTTWWWFWGLIVGTAMLIALDDHATGSDAWGLLALYLPMAVLWLFVLRRPGWLAPPLSQLFSVTRHWLAQSMALVLGCVFLGALSNPGNADPFPYVPLLNPIEVLLLVIGIGFVFWSGLEELPQRFKRLRSGFLGVGGIALVTSITLRAVHQWAGIPWGPELIESNLAQLSLTVVWSVCGVWAWLWGSRKAQYPVWLAGAVTLGIVLLKLLVVDRESLGNLFGIASFLAYGLLCIGLGFFAPVPPRRQQGEATLPATQAEP